MRILGNPLIWLLRVRHRCGYGVHSPFAFRFVTELCYEKLPFYAFGPLDKNLPLHWRFRRKKGLHMLFRLANEFQPRVISMPEKSATVRIYLEQSCPNATLQEECRPTADSHLIYLTQPHPKAITALNERCVLVLDNLHRHRKWFRSLPAVVSFDLYDIGVAFFDPKYCKQYYIINF